MEQLPTRSALQLSSSPRMVESSEESQHPEEKEDFLGPGDNNQPEFTREQERKIIEGNLVSPVKPMPVKATEQTQPTSLTEFSLPPIGDWYEACKVDDEYLNFWAGHKVQSTRDREVEEEHKRLEIPTEQSAFKRYTPRDEAEDAIRRAAQSKMYSQEYMVSGDATPQGDENATERNIESYTQPPPRHQLQMKQRKESGSSSESREGEEDEMDERNILEEEEQEDEVE